MKFVFAASILAKIGFTSEEKVRECDLMCAAIYSVDMVNCVCVPILGLECSAQYGSHCDQKEYDLGKGDIIDYKGIGPVVLDSEESDTDKNSAVIGLMTTSFAALIIATNAF